MFIYYLSIYIYSAAVLILYFLVGITNVVSANNYTAAPGSIDLTSSEQL
jgi:hypothetical protein